MDASIVNQCCYWQNARLVRGVRGAMESGSTEINLC